MVATYGRMHTGEPALDGIVTDREQIYSREVRLGEVEMALQAVAPAGSGALRNCRLSAQFANAEAVEPHLDRMFPEARRTEPVVQRTPIGDTQLLSISVQWLAPRAGIGAVTATVEVFGPRRKATLTAVPAAP